MLRILSSIGFFTISNSNQYKMQFLRMITIYILQVRIIQSYKDCVHFITYLTSKVAKSRNPLLDLANLTNSLC